MILFAIIALALLGLASGLLLGFAYQKFAVEEDPKFVKVLSLLPGSNCGACGFAGCRGLAEALVAGKAEVTGCLLGGAEVGKAIAEALGIEGNEREPKAAYLRCGGGREQSTLNFDYQGVPNCKAANALGRGCKTCSYGCLGFGDCVLVCPVDAITMSKDGLPVVDIKKCIACGKCLKECPRNIFTLLPKKTHYFVNCNSNDSGAATRKACKVGCIACKLCIKACSSAAITVENNLAVIDQYKCQNGKDCCMKVCPTKCIIEFKS
ncbi:MAG: RnfABCDGE type electron transport complex subunit B [Candidatus Saganbacteria bacterium]|uniref:Ion-translocating oxidoreductase complex subunit B n=1 Tax=Candidatus Saganbacteria bacterium TaxID=2575572 RepID=A0A833NWH9_UNCSA|nr:MAG: RnfABCDGE type electron transport complex subunit B [Candidatus Saganbacteria bacterium]